MNHELPLEARARQMMVKFRTHEWLGFAAGFLIFAAADMLRAWFAPQLPVWLVRGLFFPIVLLASVVGGVMLGFGAAIGLELLDRRVRGVEDMESIAGVPVIGVLRPAGSKEPVFRRLMAPPQNKQPLLAAPGGARP